VIHSTIRRGLLLAVTGLALSAAQAFAAPALAELKTPLAKPLTAEVDGRVWKCEADKCEGNGDAQPQSLKRECKRVAAELGAMKTYSSDTGKLDEAGVAVCNAK